jgi:DGQHR domain-containing protein
MITVAAIRMEQFGVQFFQASLTARDVGKLVRFEVLSYGDKGHQPVRGGTKGKSKVNWDLLERRIAANEKSYQRQIIRRKIEELVQYYEQCREARNLPSIPGAVIIASEEPLKFESLSDQWPSLGLLKVPEREGILRAIDGQHRLLALHNDVEQFGHDVLNVPAVIFDRLPEDHVVQMFVTINAKHTRLNPSHLVSLAGRQLYSDANLAAAHDVIRALTEREDSALHGDIKLLGVGRGRVAQAPLAQELKRLFESDVFGGPRKTEDFREDSRKFFVNYFKQIATLFATSWNGRKYSIKTAPALRAFIRVAPDVVRRLDQEHADRTDFRAIGRVIAPWGRRIGDMRFETDSAWKRNGSGIDQLAKELRLALQYPEGAVF